MIVPGRFDCRGCDFNKSATQAELISVSLERNKGAWVPAKRTFPEKALKPRYERKKQRLRVKLRDLSHTAFIAATEKNDLNIYLGIMRPIYRKYQKSNSSWVKRMLSFCKRAVKKVLQSLPRSHH